MKVGLFSDPHYCKADDIGLNRRPALSFDKIKGAMEDFKKQGVELCFCLGDLVDHASGDTKEKVLENLNKILTLVRSYGIPFYLVPGNHDYVDFSRKDLKDAGLLISDLLPFVEVDTAKCKFVLIDANIRSSGNHFDIEGHVWDDACLDDTLVEKIAASLRCDKECIVMVHENLDPTVDQNHIIKNSEALCKAIKESGTVKLVLQGHFHYGSDWYDQNIHYHTLKAMCLGEENYYEVIEI